MCNYLYYRNFKVGDAFVGYQDDTPAAVVFQVTHLLKNDESETSDEALARWKAKVGSKIKLRASFIIVNCKL